MASNRSRSPIRRNRQTRSGDTRQETPREEPAVANPQKDFFDWAKAQRHKDTWLLTGRALEEEGCARGLKILRAEGSRILLDGFNENETKLLELRAEVQLSRGKVSPPLRKIELDPKTKPSDEELQRGSKFVSTKIVVLSDSQQFPAEVNADKHPLFPALILRGVLESKEGSKDRERAAEMTKQLAFQAAMAAHMGGGYQPF